MSASQSSANLSTAQQILLQKQKEHAGLQALRESSAALLERVEKLAEMSNVMADGGEGELPSAAISVFGAPIHCRNNIWLTKVAVGSVLRNWPHVFSILNMFGMSLSDQSEASVTEYSRTSTTTSFRSKRPKSSR
jgi:hypothetical protein